MKVNVQILIPTHDHNPSLFTYDLASLCIYTAMAIPPDEGHSIGLCMGAGTYVHRSRQDVLEDALSKDATHLLWLDSDMRFPPDTLIRLLQREERFVGINYSKRTVDADYVAIKKCGKDRTDPGQKCITTAESTGLEEVEAIGFGCVLMTASVLNKFPDPKKEPWFWYGMRNGQHVGEDVWFCEMARERGEKIYVDHDLSKLCGHVGTFEYKTAHAEAHYKFEGKL